VDGGAEAASDDGSAGDAGSDDAGAAVLDEDPISVVVGSAHEHEPSVAVSPHGRVAVSFLSYVGSGGIAYTVGYWISNDAGATWGPGTLFPVPPGDNIQANSSVAADDQDNLYVAWASEGKTATGVRTGLHVWVAKAAPGETQFGAPVEVTDPNESVLVYDLPRIAVTASGAVNITYLKVSADGTTEWLVDARSTDFKSWSRSVVAGPGSPQSYRNWGRICRPPGAGRIYYSYLDSDVATYEGDTGVALRWSDDDGATWSAPVAVQTKDDELLEAGWATDCVTDGHDVWVLTTLSPDAPFEGAAAGSPALVCSLTSLRLAHSGDQGQTFDSTVDVADPRAGHRFMYPVLVTEGGGVLDLAYYAGAADDDKTATLRRTRSTDGKTFAPSVLVHQPLTLETSRTVPQWIGDYVGRAYAGGNLYVVYVDNAGAKPHIAFYRTPVGLPAGAQEPDAGSSVDAGPGEAGTQGCNPQQPFTPRPWAPPTAFGQGACSVAQTQAYLACTSAGSCAAFRADTTNAACLACIETDVGASAHGPFVTQTQNATVSVIETNFGGCQAHYDGQTAAGCCGNQVNDDTDCYYAACGACSDFSNPAQFGPTYDCYYTSMDEGVCSSHRVTNACYFEQLDGGPASACTDPNLFLPLWCGH
jgi:hypothetical protein